MFSFRGDADLLKRVRDMYFCTSEELESSYARCCLSGVKNLQHPQAALPEAALSVHIASNALLLSACEIVINQGIRVTENSSYIFILSDPGLVCLKIYAGHKTLEKLAEAGIRPGIFFTEESCGTNALSLAHRHKRLVAIKGEQHYCRFFKEWWCVSAPVKDDRDSILGYLDVSTHESSQLELTLPLLEFLLAAVKRELHFLALFSVAAENASSLLPSVIRESLTLREKEVLLRLASRLTSKEIAEELDLSVETVRTHRRNVYRKLGREVVLDFIRSNRCGRK